MPKIKECLELEHSIKYFCCSTLESRVDFSHPNLTKIAVTYQTKEEAIEKAKQINDLFGSFANAFYVTKNSVEITSSLASKEKGIEEIVKRKILQRRIFIDIAISK